MGLWASVLRKLGDFVDWSDLYHPEVLASMLTKLGDFVDDWPNLYYPEVLVSMLRKLGDFVDELSTSHYCGISNENICMTLSQAEIYSWDIIVLYDFVTSRMSFKKKAFYV